MIICYKKIIDIDSMMMTKERREQLDKTVREGKLEIIY